MRIDKDVLIETVEKYVELSLKTDEEERKLNLANDRFEELMDAYIEAVKKESSQAKTVRRLAGVFFESDSENWDSFLSFAWNWAQSVIDKNTAIRGLNNAIEKHNQHALMGK